MFFYKCSFLPNFSLGVLNPHVPICGFLPYFNVYQTLLAARKWPLSLTSAVKDLSISLVRIGLDYIL